MRALAKWLVCLGLWLAAVPMWGQTPADSVEQSGASSIYYDIARTRLIRWLRLHAGDLEAEERARVIELMEDAAAMAGEQDYETALLLLDTAAEVSGMAGNEKAEQAQQSPPAEKVEFPSSEPATGWAWVPQVVTGVDWWRQSFELGFAAAADSMFIESSGNPFVGLRLKSDARFSHNGEFTGLLLAKYSRDYASGELQTRMQKGNWQTSHWFWENRFEATRYRTNLQIQFVENRSTLQGGLQLWKNVVLYAGDDMWLRRYRQSSEFYPSHTQNRIYSGFQYTSGLSTRLSGAFHFLTRRHPDFAVDDFNESRIEASVYQVTAINSSIYLENIWRRRDYLHGDTDSTYQNSFQEEFFRADLRFGLNRWLSFDFQGDLTLRQHKILSTITPDFAYIRANPRFLFRLFGDWQLGLGYLYTLQVYSKDIIRTSPVVSVTDAETFLSYEDYFSHGLSVSLELFRLGAFMLSLTDQYEFRTYPNSPVKNVDRFGFYTDRRINSLVMFLNWQIGADLEVNFIANLDDDRSRVENHTDSRNSILSIDLAYSL